MEKRKRTQIVNKIPILVYSVGLDDETVQDLQKVKCETIKNLEEGRIIEKKNWDKECWDKVLNNSLKIPPQRLDVEEEAIDYESLIMDALKNGDAEIYGFG